MRVGFLIALVLVAPALAVAEQDAGEGKAREERAASLYREAKLHYNLAEYARAIELFAEAYRLTEAPGFLYNIAQSHRLRGDCRNAARFYRNYLRDRPAAPNRSEVEQRIAEMERCPKPKRVQLVPPSRAPVESAPETPTVNAPTSSRPDQDSRWQRAAGVTLVGIGTASVLASIWLHLEARDAQGQLDERALAGGEWSQEDRRLEQRRDRLRAGAVVGYALAGTGLLAGGWLWWSTDVEAAPTGLAVDLGPRGALMEATWTF